MKKLVKFEGQKGKIICCDNPGSLKVGEVYEVITETNLGWQLNYHLKGIPGEYNAKWFSVIEPEKK